MRANVGRPDITESVEDEEEMKELEAAGSDLMLPLERATVAATVEGPACILLFGALFSFGLIGTYLYSIKSGSSSQTKIS